MSVTDLSILIVDDLKMMRTLLGSLCVKLGFSDVDQAASGDEALALMKRRPYGLVLSDLNMEPMSGLELLRRVRADEALKATPLILMTASLDTNNVIAAKRAGVDQFLMKPFSPTVLRERIESVFAPRRRQG